MPAVMTNSDIFRTAGMLILNAICQMSAVIRSLELENVRYVVGLFAFRFKKHQIVVDSVEQRNGRVGHAERSKIWRLATREILEAGQSHAKERTIQPKR